MFVECPNCHKKIKISKGQIVFACLGRNGCGFQCTAAYIRGSLKCTDDQWYLENTIYNPYWNYSCIE